MLYLGMTHSNDLRERVIKYVEDGGAKRRAAEIFGVCRQTVYAWISEGIKTASEPRVVSSRVRKLDKQELAEHVRAHPDMLLRERAAHFGVRVNAIWVALKRLRIAKKNEALPRARYYEKNRVSRKTPRAR
jgi:transposase